MAHSHSHKCTRSLVERDTNKFIRILSVIFVFILIEIWGHYKSNSLSLLADSVHLIVDFLGFLVSLTALKWTQKKSNNTMSFGYGRVEILGALLSIFLIWIATAYLIFESYHKIFNPIEIKGEIFVTISVLGLFVNIFCLYALSDSHEHVEKNKNLNIRAAHIHIIGDIIQSVGVILASLIVLINPKWVIVDIICTLVFSVIVFATTIFVVRDGLYILAERIPKDINIEDLKEDLLKIINAEEIVELRIWSISTNEKAICVHIRISDIWKYESGLLNAKAMLFDKYNFKFSTIQFETVKTREFTPEVSISENFLCKESIIMVGSEKITKNFFR